MPIPTSSVLTVTAPIVSAAAATTGPGLVSTVLVMTTPVIAQIPPAIYADNVQTDVHYEDILNKSLNLNPTA